MKGLGSSCCKPCQVKGVIVAIHELFHLSQVDLIFYFKTSYLFSFISKLLDKSFIGLTIRRNSGMHSLNRIFSDSSSSYMGSVLSSSSGSLMDLLLFFFLCTGVSSLLITGSSKSFTEVSSFLSKGILIPLPLPFYTRASCFSSSRIFNAFSLLLWDRGLWFLLHRIFNAFSLLL
jgi:hypothetical protein